MGTGSREERQNKKLEPPFPFNRNGKGSSMCVPRLKHEQPAGRLLAPSGGWGTSAVPPLSGDKQTSSEPVATGAFGPRADLRRIFSDAGSPRELSE
jgi:hypothetical protein